MMTRAIQEENRMKLTMLGTGNALVTECYNTCFVLSDEYGHFWLTEAAEIPCFPS